MANAPIEGAYRNGFSAGVFRYLPPAMASFGREVASSQRRLAMGLTACVLIAVSIARPADAYAQRDFDLSSDAWNGLSRFVALARQKGSTLTAGERFDLGELSSSDALLLIGPLQELPVEELTAFMHVGGRVALADDFGDGESLLHAFQIRRGEPRSAAPTLRDNPELRIAAAVSNHPLTEQVPALVTNHARVVFHEQLEPVFAFGEHDAVVLAGAVLEGRLVALSDPSVLINNMLELRSNRRFALNLITYLRGPLEGRLIICGPETRLRGRYGEIGADRPLHDVRSALEALAKVELPSAALRIAAALLAAILLVIGAGLLPRVSPYVGGAVFGKAAAGGGFTGKVQFHASEEQLGEPLRAYAEEFQAELRSAFSLPKTASDKEVLEAMKARHFAAEVVDSVASLSSALEELRARELGAGNGAALGPGRFVQLVKDGEDALARIQGHLEESRSR